jgi:thymidylate synthase ThyX
MAEKYKREIYALEDLSPEVKAVTFAKCSRSPESFREIARELTEEASSKFHEKWVVGYGHSSVAEHAVLSLALENISILATKVVEDCRLASYTEKSTRYQVFDRDKYYKPKKIISSEFVKLYEETANYLFDTYTDLVPKFIEFFKTKNPRSNKTPEKLYEMTCKAQACDIIRYLLPTATLTNLGMTINARNLEYAISKFLSHPLDEIKEIGKELKEASLKIIPTLIKYADYNKYIDKTHEAMEKLSKKILNFSEADDKDAVTLVDYDKEAEDKLTAFLLYRFSKYPYRKIWQKVKKLNQKEKEKIIDEALKRKGEYDRPLRELEHVYYTFDILVDYGAFRDIQRHRMCTQTNQDATCEHGYAMPYEFQEVGARDQFIKCMERAKEAYDQIFKKFPKEAQYIVPLAFKKRVLITWNLRELFHFIPLRSSPKGHISYRVVAQKIFDEIEKVHPGLARYIKVYK